MPKEEDVEEIGEALNGAAAPAAPSTSSAPAPACAPACASGSKEKWEMTTEEKLAEGRRLREEGNAHHKKGNYEDAASSYEKALGFFYFYHESFDEKGYEDEVEQGRIVLHLNLAASLLALKKYDAAEDQLKTVLKNEKLDESQRAKALYRSGHAKIGLHEWDSAVEQLTAAAKLDPANSSIRAAIEKAKKGKIEDAQKVKQLYSSMVKAPRRSTPDSVPETQSPVQPPSKASPADSIESDEAAEKRAAEKALAPDDDMAASKASRDKTQHLQKSTRNTLFSILLGITVLLVFSFVLRRQLTEVKEL